MDNHRPPLAYTRGGGHIGVYEALWLELADGTLRSSCYLNPSTRASPTGEDGSHNGCLASVMDAPGPSENAGNRAPPDRGGVRIPELDARRAQVAQGQSTRNRHRPSRRTAAARRAPIAGRRPRSGTRAGTIAPPAIPGSARGTRPRRRETADRPSATGTCRLARRSASLQSSSIAGSPAASRRISITEPASDRPLEQHRTQGQRTGRLPAAVIQKIARGVPHILVGDVFGRHVLEAPSVQLEP